MMSIGAFSKMSNTTAKTLRYYDEIALFKPKYISEVNSYRYYGVEQLKVIMLINRLKLYGFSLSEIKIIVLNQSDNELILKMIIKQQQNIKNQMNKYANIFLKLDEDINNLRKGADIMPQLEDLSVELVSVEPRNVLYLRRKINIKNFAAFIGELFSLVATENYTPIGAPITFYHDEEFTPENYDVEVAISVKEKTEMTKQIPQHLCAMVSYQGSYDNLVSVYAKLNEYVDKEDYKLNGSPYEIYLTNPANVLPEENIVEIFLPVIKK